MRGLFCFLVLCVIYGGGMVVQAEEYLEYPADLPSYDVVDSGTYADFVPPPIPLPVWQPPHQYQQMYWDFFVHAYPDFESEVVASFTPQRIIFTEQTADGWGFVYTYRGDGWVYLPNNRFFVPHSTGLFAYKGQARPESRISSQVVNVLYAQDTWIKVDTWVGPMWINRNFTPCTEALDAHLRRYGSNVAVFYMNTETGFTYMFNPDRVFFSASVNKIQHALYMYHLAELGGIDLNRVHTYTSRDYSGGTGRIRHMPFGRQFTTQELLTYSIRFSDNVAFRMLVRDYGLYGYMNFVREIEADETLVRNITGANITARDAGVWAYAVFQYVSSDGEYAPIFLHDLMNTNAQLIRASYPIANKYGWATNSFHDMAIVYADSPYILVILSNMSDGAFGTFASISRLFENFHQQYF